MNKTGFQVKRRIPKKAVHTQTQLELTAKSWIIYNLTDGHVIREHKAFQPREVASLTKIMTCLLIVQQFSLELQSPLKLFRSSLVLIRGTSAELETGDVIKVIDLLYGLMLPSGNDAAQVLAAFWCQMKGKGDDRSITPFVDEMNYKAKALGMKNTKFSNPHGLSDGYNKSYSNAVDMIKLTREAISHELIRKIVFTRMHLCIVQEEDGWTRQMIWENTNKMLSKRAGIKGLKTGSTKAAGFCLALYGHVNNKEIASVTLYSKDKQNRWRDNQLLWQTSL